MFYLPRPDKELMKKWKSEGKVTSMSSVLRQGIYSLGRERGWLESERESDN